MNGAFDTLWNGQYNILDGVYCDERDVFVHQELGKYLYHMNGYWLGYSSLLCENVNVINVSMMRVYDTAIYIHDVTAVWDEIYGGVWVRNEDLEVDCPGIVSYKHTPVTLDSRVFL
jgi:hypothetical protein